MINIVRFKDSEYQGYTRTAFSLEKLKAIKEVDDEKVYEVSADDVKNLQEGWIASLDNGVVSVTKPEGWKSETEIIAEEKTRKESAKSKLEALGLTTEEIEASFGI